MLNQFGLLRVPFGPSPLTRDVLVKEHEGKEENAVFIVHLDALISEENVAKFLATFGPIAYIHAKSKHPNRGICMSRVEFETSTGKDRCLRQAFPICQNLMKLRNSIAGFIPPPKSSIEKEVRFLLPKSGEELEREIELKMENSEKMEVYPKGPIVDDDGFTLVTGEKTKDSSGFAVASFKPGEGSGIRFEGMGISSSKKRARKANDWSRQDFYRFQLKEQKRQEIAQARLRNIMDHETIEEMQKMKKFRIE